MAAFLSPTLCGTQSNKSNLNTEILELLQFLKIKRKIRPREKQTKETI